VQHNQGKRNDLVNNVNEVKEEAAGVVPRGWAVQQVL
jgi:hypothetical protein